MNHARHMAESLKRTELAALQRLVVDYAWWDATVDNAVLATNDSWIEENLTTWLHDNSGIDLVAVLDVQGALRLLYPQDLQGEADLLPQLHDFSDAAEAAADGAVVGVGGFVRLGSQVYSGASAVIAREDEAPAPGAPRPTLFLGKLVDTSALGHLGETFLLDGLRVIPGPGPLDQVSVVLPDVSGQPVAILSWDPPRTTIDLSRELTIASLAILVLFVGLLALLAQRTDSLVGMAATAAEGQAAARRAAEDADRMKSRLLRNVSHELRTPLNAILGFTALMRSESLGKLPDPRYVQYLTAVHQGGLRLIRVVDDTLDLVQIEGGERQLESRRFELAEVVAAAVGQGRTLAAEVGSELRLAEAEGPAPMEGDPAAVQRIVSILVQNALAFSPAAEPVEIRLRREPEGRAVVEVADRGAPVSEGFCASSYQPFEIGLQPEPRTGEGAGIGLAVAGRLAARLGGSIRFSVREGGGMIAALVLPPAMTAAGGMEAATGTA